MADAPLDILNMALAYLGKAPVESLESDEPFVVWFNGNYVTLRDSIVIDSEPTFATRRFIVDKDLDPWEVPVFEYDYAYLLDYQGGNNCMEFTRAFDGETTFAASGVSIIKLNKDIMAEKDVGAAPTYSVTMEIDMPMLDRDIEGVRSVAGGASTTTYAAEVELATIECPTDSNLYTILAYAFNESNQAIQGLFQIDKTTPLVYAQCAERSYTNAFLGNSIIFASRDVIYVNGSFDSLWKIDVNDPDSTAEGFGNVGEMPDPGHGEGLAWDGTDIWRMGSRGVYKINPAQPDQESDGYGEVVSFRRTGQPDYFEAGDGVVTRYGVIQAQLFIDDVLHVVRAFTKFPTNTDTTPSDSGWYLLKMNHDDWLERPEEFEILPGVGTGVHPNGIAQEGDDLWVAVYDDSVRNKLNVDLWRLNMNDLDSTDGVYGKVGVIRSKETEDASGGIGGNPTGLAIRPAAST